MVEELGEDDFLNGLRNKRGVGNREKQLRSVKLSLGFGAGVNGRYWCVMVAVQQLRQHAAAAAAAADVQ